MVVNQAVGLEYILSAAKNNQTPERELKDKLKQIRADYTRAKNLLSEISKYHKEFVGIRAELDDEDNGLVANREWIKTQRAKVDTLATEAQAKLDELKRIITIVNETVDELSAKNEEFKVLAAKVFDPTTGLEALYLAAKTWHDNIQTYEQQLKKIVADAQTELGTIETASESVTDAYTEFQALLAKVNDPKTGVEAQFNIVAQYAEDALKAKTDAEKELAAVIALKDQGGTILEAIRDTEATVKGMQKESQSLTDDIRNTLGLTSSKSLSAALGKKSDELNTSLKWWASFVGIAIFLLAVAVCAIFYVLFIYHPDGGRTFDTITGNPTFVAVVSKLLFTSPFIFGLYFAASNFSHVRDLRDKYAFKETIAKSLQAYIKLLRSEFEETDGGNKEEYKQARLDFSLSIMDTIYKEPVSSPKKKRYNFAFGKVFQVAIEDEDLRHHFEKVMADGVEDLVDERVMAKVKPSEPKAKQ